MNDISKYDEAGAEKEPNRKGKLDALTGARQAFGGAGRWVQEAYGGGCFGSFCPLKKS